MHANWIINPVRNQRELKHLWEGRVLGLAATLCPPSPARHKSMLATPTDLIKCRLSNDIPSLLIFPKGLSTVSTLEDTSLRWESVYVLVTDKAEAYQQGEIPARLATTHHWISWQQRLPWHRRTGSRQGFQTSWLSGAVLTGKTAAEEAARLSCGKMALVLAGSWVTRSDRLSLPRLSLFCLAIGLFPQPFVPLGQSELSSQSYRRPTWSIQRLTG